LADDFAFAGVATANGFSGLKAAGSNLTENGLSIFKFLRKSSNSAWPVELFSCFPALDEISCHGLTTPWLARAAL
jgi:hypothetical protein